jgi:outer membrane protein assembly factor BamB
MRTLAAALTVALALVSPAMPQGRAVDWPTLGGDARRSGWERSDTRITQDNVKDFQLIWKRKMEPAVTGAHALTPPVVIGLLISYRGFKELGFVSGSSGDLWAIDVDLNRVFWQKRFEPATAKSGVCAGTASGPALIPPMIFGGRRRTGSRPTASPSPGLPPTPAGRTTELPARFGRGGFGAPRPVFLVTGDGQLHQVNTSDGSDQFPPVKFVPAGAKASGLAMNDYVVYAATRSGCGGAPNAIWAIDLRRENAEPVSFTLPAGEASGLGGFAVGYDGTVYVQSGNTLLALGARDLKVKGTFSAGGKADPAFGATPVVFEHQGKYNVVSAGADGRLYVHDPESVGGRDSKTPLSQTVPLTSAKGGIGGGLSTWEDDAGTRWVAAPVWGPLNAELKAPVTNGPTPNGSVVAFRLEEQNGAPVLIPAWVSRDLNSPVPPVVTSGVVFALSTGGKAILYGLDAATGKELYSTGSQVHAAGALTGMTVANGRVFFTTADGTLYAFGIYMEI